MNYPAGRPGAVADRLLDEIVSGRYPPGSRLPTEPELCAAMGVSRATVREAMKSLQQRGVTSIEQGRGTFVTSMERWSPLDPVLLAARSATDQGLGAAWAAKLIEARRVVEVGVAALAAERRSPDDLAAMAACMDSMRAAEPDVAAFAQADLAFHRAVMRAADNEMIQALFDPLSQLIQEGRVQTSRPPERRALALEAHAAILEAIRAKDTAAAAGAMREHLTETLSWVEGAPRRDPTLTTDTPDN
jgi:GntR family transcriptional regulator, transcriptional repressor for pyruvate dehydrogenase complex